MIEISRKSGLIQDIDESGIKHVLSTFLGMLFEGTRSISLHLTDNEEIRNLNREQRGIDRPTDILSWSYYEDDPEAEWVGDLMVSLERVEAQAESYGWDTETELTRLLAHGCVHLAGWDHERSGEEAREMLKLEIELLNAVGYEELYPK